MNSHKFVMCIKCHIIVCMTTVDLVTSLCLHMHCSAAAGGIMLLVNY